MRMREEAQENPTDANAQTHIELLQHDPLSGLARYGLRPITGKKHQLRVHMAALGIPILNDPLYPVAMPPASTTECGYAEPLQLLARTIAFTDPMNGAQRLFHSRRQLQWPVPSTG